MVTVISHSLGVDDHEGKRIISTKTFRRKGVLCKLYILKQKLTEDYIEVRDDTSARQQK